MELFTSERVACAGKPRMEHVMGIKTVVKKAVRQVETAITGQEPEIDLLDTLATLCRNRIRLRDANASYDQLTEQNTLQRRSFELLDINPNRV